jgi:hypothetical protein
MLSAPRRFKSAPGVTADKVQSIVIGVTPVVGIPPRVATIYGERFAPHTGSV